MGRSVLGGSRFGLNVASDKRLTEFFYELIGLSVRVIVSDTWRRDVVSLEGSTRGDNLEIGMRLANGLEEHREAIFDVGVPAQITGQPVFVADLDILQLERLRVAQFGASGTPFGVYWPSDEFNLVHGIIDEGLQLLSRDWVVVERTS